MYHPVTENIILAVICMNAFTLTVELITPIPGYVDKILLSIFIGEAIIKTVTAIMSHHYYRFTNSRFWFDIVVIVLAFVPGGQALRTFRLMRLIPKIAIFRELSESLANALVGVMGMLAFVTFQIFVLALLGAHAFGDIMPEYFGEGFTNSLITTTAAILYGELLYDPHLAIQYNPLVGWLFYVLSSMVNLIILGAVVVAVILDKVNEHHQKT